MIQTIVTLFGLAALLLCIAVLLGWRPGPRSWWADRREEAADPEEFHAVTLGHGRRESAVPDARLN